MKMSVSLEPARSSPDCAAASSARRLVVPTATTRPPRARGFADRVDRGLRNRVALAVHPVVGDVVHPHRLEGAGAHMQGHLRRAHPLFAQGIQHRFVEMQPGRRRRHRAGLRSHTRSDSAPRPRRSACARCRAATAVGRVRPVFPAPGAESAAGSDRPVRASTSSVERFGKMNVRTRLAARGSRG